MPHRKWLGLFVGYQAPDDPEPRELTQAHLQKGLFLLWKAAGIPGGDDFRFQAYDFGPMSPEIYRGVEEMESLGMVTSRQDAEKPLLWYRATDLGVAFAKELAIHAEVQPYLAHLEVIRRLLLELSFGEIIAAIYAAYPEYSTATVVPDLLPGGRRGARGDLATLLTPEEIAFRVQVLTGSRQIQQGRYVRRVDLLNS